MSFTPTDYIRFMDRARADGYEIRPFDRPDRITQPDEQVILNRHDIDLDLDAAVRMADLEHEFGIQATYFVLLTSPLYNPASEYGIQRVRQIRDLGHDIGLHCDARSSHHAVSLDVVLNTQLHSLSQISGTLVGSVSWHKPAEDLIGTDWSTPDSVVYAYGNRYINDIEYCSDSTGQWRYGPPDKRLAYEGRRALHLCTHPETWMR